MSDDRKTTAPDRSVVGLSEATPEAEPGAHPFGFGEEARYRELEVVGEGGLGTVIRTRDRFLGRDVALKRIGANARTRDPSAMQARFLREARITARLDHPGIVPVHDAGVTEDGRLYYTMRLIRGRSLADVAAAAHSAEQRLALLGSVTAACHAVGYAHREGIVHRDLKPANVMIGALGETQVVDWGLAEELSAEAPEHVGFAGTLAYASPEALRGERPSIASDVWSLGVILHEVISGQPRFDGGVTEVEAALRAEHVPPARWPEGCPPELAAIGDRAMATEPARRYADAQAMAEDLEAYRDGRRVTAHRYSAVDLLRRAIVAWRWPFAAVAALVLGTIGALALTAHRTERQRERAVTAEAEVRTQLARTDRSLAEARAAGAILALAEGSIARAESYALAALEHGEEPDARGVLAATFAAPRPRVVERVALPDCPEVIALDAETALCPSPSSLTAWRVAPQRRLWTQPIAIAGAVALGDRLVVAWDTRAELVLLDTATGAETERVRGLARIADVARALDGQRVIAHDGETVIAFAADGGARTVRRACGDRAVAAAATSTRDTYVVCARGELGRLADDGLASIAETGFGTEIPGATALAVSEDGLDLAIGSAAGDIQLVDGRGCFSAGCQGSRTLMLARILPGAIRRLAVLDPSGVLAIGDRGDAVRIRRGASAELSRLPITADRPITFLEGGDLVVGGAAWHRWAVDDEAPPARLVHDRGLRAAAIAGDRRTAATITDDDELVIWDAARGTRTRTIAVPGARTVTLGPDGAEIVVTTRDGAVRYATATGARLGDARVPGTVAGALATATAGTSTWVVDGELRVWRVDGERVERAGAAVGAVAMAVSADGSTVATADRHRVAIGAVAIEVAGADVSALALSPDGRRLALGTSTGRVEVWDLASRRLLARLPAHAQRVAWLQLEGDRLWTAGDDGDLRWWALFALDASREELVARSRASWGAFALP